MRLSAVGPGEPCHTLSQEHVYYAYTFYSDLIDFALKYPVDTGLLHLVVNNVFQTTSYPLIQALPYENNLSYLRYTSILLITLLHLRYLI